MARVNFEVGASADLLTPTEHRDILVKVIRGLEAEAVRGIKHMRLPQLQGVVSGTATLLLGHDQKCGPDSGFAWCIRRLVITGLSGGTSPDIVNVYINNAEGVPVWQFNGNNFGYTFGKGEFTLYGGDHLLVANDGALTATGMVTIAGEVTSVPQEMLAKIVA
ncbi:MAG TPA: hypothetical protein VGG50_11475 [Streptosporangiaceae bacterium]